MPYTTVVAGTTITAAWANANVRDQVITPFASSAARASAVTAPIEGMYAHLNDTNKLEHYNGSAWVPAVSNIVASMTPKATGDGPHSGDATTDMAIGLVPVRSDRLYTVHWHTSVEISAVARWIINFYVDGVLTERLADLQTVGFYNFHPSVACQWRPTTGSKNVDVRVDFINGSGTIFFGAAAQATRQFWIEDTGPR